MFLLAPHDTVPSGNITDEMLWEAMEKGFKDHPQVEKGHMKQQHCSTVICGENCTIVAMTFLKLFILILLTAQCSVCNCKGYQLTEEQFIKNMWPMMVGICE